MAMGARVRLGVWTAAATLLVLTLMSLDVEAVQHVVQSDLKSSKMTYKGPTTPSMYLPDKHFSINKSQVTWEEAREQCKSQNKVLATILSEKDQNKIESLLRNDPPEISLWTAGRMRSGSIPNVVWNTTTNYSPYTNWDDGQPYIGDQPPQQCLALLNINYKWWLAQCSNKKPFICESSSVM